MKDKNLALNVLKTEEKQLLKIASDLQDYLTRLKVNELTLLSLIKSKTIEQEERNILPCTSRGELSMEQAFGTSINDCSLNDLDLKLEVPQVAKDEEEEMEEEDEDDEVEIVGSGKINTSNLNQLQAFLDGRQWQHGDEENDEEFDMSEVLGGY